MNIVNRYLSILFIFLIFFYKKTKFIKIDDYLTNKILENIYIFKNIHPNIITISGLIINYYIYYLLDTLKSNKYLLGFCIIYRWLIDCLDGAIARKYNKSSKLGHHLDTLSDIIISFIAFYSIQKHIFNWSFNTCLIIYVITVFIFIYNNIFDIINTHDNLKNIKKKNMINYSVSFLINNSIILYILFICSLF